MSPKQRVIAANKYNPSCQLKVWRSRLPTQGAAVEGQTIKEKGDIIIVSSHKKGIVYGA